MKRMMAVAAAVVMFALAAPAAAQERSGRIPLPGGGIGFKLQTPWRTSPRPRVGTVYSSDASSAQRSTTNAEARRGRQPSPEQEIAKDLAELQRGITVGSGTRVGRSIVVPPGTKHTAPNLNDVLIGLSFEGAYDKDVATKVQEEAGKRGAYFTDSCDPRPIVCIVVHDPEPAGTFSGNGSGSWNGPRSSNWGSSSETGNLYGVVISAHLLVGDQNEDLGDKGDGFKATTHFSEYSANSGHNDRGGNASQGGSTTTINRDLAVQSGAAKTVKKMVRSFLKDKKNWRPGAAQLIREAFGQK